MSAVQDTPSIGDREIMWFRDGRPLRYGELIGREKRDYLLSRSKGQRELGGRE